MGPAPEGADERSDGQRLTRLAEEANTSGRKISPMQLAAQILEDALARLPDQERP